MEFDALVQHIVTTIREDENDPAEVFHMFPNNIEELAGDSYRQQVKELSEDDWLTVVRACKQLWHELEYPNEL